MTLRVAVDFGTSSTCVAIAVDGREPQVVMVDGGSPVMPSAVFAAADGELFVGQEAERQAAIDPARYEPNPKRHVDEGELLLGDSVVPVLAVVRAVLSRAVGEARRVAGGAGVDLLVLTHPADWGAIRMRVLRQAAQGLAAEAALVPEPVAAAVFHAASHALPDGAALAVLDLGGGTVDVSVVRRQPPESPERAAGTAESAGFRVLATHGDPNFGGADIDQLLLDHVGAGLAEADQPAWRALMEGREMSDRRRRRVLRQDVRGAKETLSRHPYTDVPMPPPFPDAHVTREDLERLITAPLRRAAELTARTIADAGLGAEQPAGVFLVGGSSRIPLVARLVRETTGILPATLDQPETVVARGALRAVTLDPLRTGGLPGVRPQPGPYRRPPGQYTPPGGHPGPPRPPLPRTGPPQPQQQPQPQGNFGPSSGRFAPAPPPRPAGFPAAFPNEPEGPTVAIAKSAVLPGRRRAWLLGGGAVVVVALVVAGLFVFGPLGRSAPAPQPVATAGPLIAQYDYRFTAPADWVQTGANGATLAVQVAPRNAQSGPLAIYVQEFPLDFDSSANRDQGISELRSLVTKANYADFQSSSSYAGREVAEYRQPATAGKAAVNWYVVFSGRVQVSVGCQYGPAGPSTVDSACQEVVRGLTVTRQ